MIIKGKSRAAPGKLSDHLLNAEKNERVQLLETRGTIATDLRGALIEMDARAEGSRVIRSLYHAAISPAQQYRLTPEQRTEAIDLLEEALGLRGMPRVVVIHEKLGREHIHVVWSRMDLEKLRVVRDSFNYLKHEMVARELERRFDHERVQGAHHERDGVNRPDRTPSRSELRQEERTGIKGKDVKELVTAAFLASEGPEEFRQSLMDRKLILAKGDRRDFVVVDWKGGIHSLSRRLSGMKAEELRTHMAPLDKSQIPDISQARLILSEIKRWKKSYAKGIERDAARYSRGEDYVSQTNAARVHHGRRQYRRDQTSMTNRTLERIELDIKEADQKEREEAGFNRRGEASGRGRSRSR